MPPMPPRGSRGERVPSCSSATRLSVVRTIAATEAAFWSAQRVTLVGSTMPQLDHVAVRLLGERRSRSRPCRAAMILSMMTLPSRPAFAAIWRTGSSSALQHDAARRSSRRRSRLGDQLLDRGDGVEQRRAAAGDDAFLNSRLGRGQSVLDAQLLLLHLDLGRSADLDDGDAAGQLRQALLELLPVEIGGGGLDLGADLTRRGP